MKAQITLKSGVTVVADVSEWTTVRDRFDHTVNGFKWTSSGGADLMFVRIEDVSAVVIVDEPSVGGEAGGDVTD